MTRYRTSTDPLVPREDGYSGNGSPMVGMEEELVITEVTVTPLPSNLTVTVHQL